jgi:hypothetical protein
MSRHPPVPSSTHSTAENLPPGAPALTRITTAPERPLLGGAMLPTSTVCKWIAGFFAILLLSGLMIFWHQQGSAELRGLPASERRTLYQRTLETLQTSCAGVTLEPTPSALGEHCVQQAAFIERFPECDRACRALAKRFLPQPRR